MLAIHPQTRVGARMVAWSQNYQVCSKGSCQKDIEPQIFCDQTLSQAIASKSDIRMFHQWRG
jgi:hypothetical protein